MTHGVQHWFFVDGRWRRGWCAEVAAKEARKLLHGSQGRYDVVEAGAGWVPTQFLGPVSPPVKVPQ